MLLGHYSWTAWRRSGWNDGFNVRTVKWLREKRASPLAKVRECVEKLDREQEEEDGKDG